MEFQRNTDQQLNLSNLSSVETVEDVENVEVPERVMIGKLRLGRTRVIDLGISRGLQEQKDESLRSGCGRRYVSI